MNARRLGIQKTRSLLRPPNWNLERGRKPFIKRSLPMTEPFPSKAYQELCIEKRDELPEWEPKVADFFAYFDSSDEEWKWRVVFRNTFFYTWEQLPNHVWLPTQRQLQEMLEERGYDWLIESSALKDEDKCYEVVLFGLCSKPNTTIEMRAEGPDPETALLRCLLAVMKKEEE